MVSINNTKQTVGLPEVKRRKFVMSVRSAKYDPKENEGGVLEDRVVLQLEVVSPTSMNESGVDYLIGGTPASMYLKFEGKPRAVAATAKFYDTLNLAPADGNIDSKNLDMSVFDNLSFEIIASTKKKAKTFYNPETGRSEECRDEAGNVIYGSCEFDYLSPDEVIRRVS